MYLYKVNDDTHLLCLLDKKDFQDDKESCKANENFSITPKYFKPCSLKIKSKKNLSINSFNYQYVIADLII